MSGNTSATGGFLTPAVSPSVLEDPNLTDLLTALIVGTTGIAATLVRPRWQPEPPNTPPATTDWCGVGIMRRVGEGGLPYIAHDPGDGVDPETATDQMQRHEVLEVMASFYGPNAAAKAEALNDGLYIAQNRETLSLADAGLADVGDILTTADLVNNQWIERVDFTFFIRRQRKRGYAVLNIAEAPVNIVPDLT